jgi:translation initiation factor IF-2
MFWNRKSSKDSGTHNHTIDPVHYLSALLWSSRPVATVLILRGDLTPATNLISGTAHARVRHLSDSTGKVVKAAYPGMAVTVSGWKELPNAGDQVMQGTEADIKKAIANRRRRIQFASVVQDAEAINIQRRQDREQKEDDKKAAQGSQIDKTDDTRVQESTGPKELRLVVKGDVSGSVEAVVGALQGIGNKEVTVKIVQGTVGDVTESDVMMAKAAEGARPNARWRSMCFWD